MDLTGAHERSVQIPGNGYVETRRFFFSRRGEFVGASITVVWTDGATSAVHCVNEGGVITVGGTALYPDDTWLTAGFSPDGRATISYAKASSRDSVHWYYEADGSARVHETQWVQTGGHVESISETQWSVAPDGGPYGDVYQHLVVMLDDGGHKEVDTTRQRDGTVTTRTRVIDADGESSATRRPPLTSTPIRPNLHRKTANRNGLTPRPAPAPGADLSRRPALRYRRWSAGVAGSAVVGRRSSSTSPTGGTAHPTAASPTSAPR